MMTTESFLDYFKLVFNGLYNIEIRLNNIFSSSEIKTFLEGKSEINQQEYSQGNYNKNCNKLKNLLISINEQNYSFPTIANSTQKIYTKVEYFFRIYTNDDLNKLKKTLILGIRQDIVTQRSNIFLDDTKIGVSLSLEGIRTLMGKIIWVGYFCLDEETKPIDYINIDLGLKHGKE